MKLLPLNTTYLFCMLLNDDIVDFKKIEGVYLPISVVDDLSGLFLNPLIFYQKLNICIIGK